MKLVTDKDVRTFCRVLNGSGRTVDDFKSLKEKGEPLQLPHTARRLRLWQGVSVFDPREAAFALARRSDPPRRRIAVVQIAHDGPILCEQTGQNAAHFTLWGPAQALLDRVVSEIEAPRW